MRYQGVYVGASTGYMRDGETSVFALTGSLGAQRGMLRGLTHLDLGMYPGDNAPYYVDHLSDGRDRCRDSRNGEFVSDGRCSAVALMATFRAEGNLFLPRTESPFYIGGGYRLGGATNTPYAAAGYEPRQSAGVRTGVALRAQAGKDYVQLEVGLGGLLPKS